MALDKIWKVHSIERVPDSGAPLTPTNDTIAALTSVSMPVQASVQRQVDAGHIFATTGHIDFESVDLQFTSMMAEAMINLIGVRGRCIKQPGGETINVYVAQYGCDGPLAGDVHRRYSMNTGILFPNTATCDHRGNLAISATMRAVFEGTGTGPVTISDGVNLPSAAQIGDQSGRWSMHSGTKTQVNAKDVTNKRNINIDFGISTSTQGADSEVFDTFASLDSVLPVVSVQGVDPTWFDTVELTINGKEVTHANTRIPFRKRDGAGGYIDDATAVHIEVTAHGPAYFPDLLSGNGTDPASTSLRIEPVEDSSGNSPLIINTGVAA